MALAGLFEKTIKRPLRAIVEVALAAQKRFTGRSVQSHGFMPSIPGSGSGMGAAEPNQTGVTHGDPVDTAGLTVKEGDGTPNVNPVTTIVVPNTTLTDDGSGQVTLAYGTVSGSGTDNHLMRWDGTANGQDTGWVCDDSDSMTVADGALDLAQPSSSSVTTGNVLKVVRDLASGSTDSPVVEIVQDNAGDNQNALKIQQDSATVPGLQVNAEGQAVSGTSTGVGNTDYGGTFSSLDANSLCDFTENTAPVAAESNEVRIFGLTGGLMYARDDGGVGIHKLSNIATVQSKSANYTALTDDDKILCDSSGGDFTITLYTAVGNNGRELTITNENSGTGVVTVDPNGAQTIHGYTTIELGAGDSIGIYNDNANWWLQ